MGTAGLTILEGLFSSTSEKLEEFSVN